MTTSVTWLPTRRIGAFVAALALGLGLAALTPVAAFAADNWNPAGDLSATGQNATTPKVALSADGSRATAVWLRSDGSNTVVQAASARVNGSLATWGAPVTVSATGQNASAPQIAVSDDGTRATAVWRGFNGSNWIIQSASATVNGTSATWGTPATLSLIGRDANAPQIAVSGDGTRATAVWSRFSGTNEIVQAKSATINGTTATWGSPTNLSATGQSAFFPQIALSADGTSATAVWHRNAVIQSGSATISGTSASWESTTDLSPAGKTASTAQVAVSSDGTQAAATWTVFDSNNLTQTATAGVSGNAATWSTPATNSATGSNAFGQQIALSSDGSRATVIWFRSNGTHNIVQSASATIAENAASWGATSDVSATGQSAFEPRLAMSDDGTRAVTIWNSRPDSGPNIMQSASATITGTTAVWGAPLDLSAAGQSADDPQIALSTNGTRATAIWSRSNGTNTIVQSRSAMMFVPGAPDVGFAGDSLVITPPADTGGSPVTEYQILYTTQARIDTGKAAGIWANYWPATTSTINLATYRTAAACTPVATTALPYPGRCARPLGEHTTGKTFVYQVAAINTDGRSTYTDITVTR